MATKRNQGESTRRYQGSYTPPDGRPIPGELTLRGSNTRLNLHADDFLSPLKRGSCIKGITYTGEHLTLVDCHSPGIHQTHRQDAPPRYRAEIFPHFTAIGRTHFNPAQPCITAIHFTSTDLATLFYDFDAFGQVIEVTPIIDAVLQEHRKLRAVETGEQPLVCYFTGRVRIADVKTILGRLWHHLPSSIQALRCRNSSSVSPD